MDPESKGGRETSDWVCLSGDLLMLSQSRITALKKVNVSILLKKKNANTVARGGVTQSAKYMLCKCADQPVSLNSHMKARCRGMHQPCCWGSRERYICGGVAGYLVPGHHIHVPV